MSWIVDIRQELTGSDLTHRKSNGQRGTGTALEGTISPARTRQRHHNHHGKRY